MAAPVRQTKENLDCSETAIRKGFPVRFVAIPL